MQKLVPKYSFGVICLIFIVSPALSLPWLIKGCLERNKKFYILISIFVGLAGMLLFPPIGDQYRHAMYTMALKDKPWEEYITSNILTGKIDFILPLLEYFINNLNLPFGYIRAFLCFVCALLFLYIYDQVCHIKNLNSSKDCAPILILTFLVFPMNAICTGMRMGVSICLMVYVFSRWIFFKKHSIWDFIIIILAIFTHMGSLMYLFFYLASKLIIKKTDKLVFVQLLLVSIALSSIVYMVLNFVSLPSPLNEYFKEYTTGKFADNSYITNSLNIVGLIHLFLNLYSKIILIGYYLLNRYNMNRYTRFAYILFIIYCLTIGMFSLNNRIGIFFIIFSSFTICVRYINYKKFIKLMAYIFIISSLFSWRFFVNVRYKSLFLPFLMAINNDYDEQWIEKNVSDDGGFKIYN